MQTRNLGITIGAIGILMMIYTGFNYVTEKKLVDMGPIQISKEIDHPVKWSPVIGAVLVIGGIVLIVANKSKTLST